MNSPLTIRRFEAREWQTYRELRLRALLESPDAFGSTYDVESGRADAEWARRIEVGARVKTELPLVAWVDGMAIGLAWGRVQEVEAEAVHVYQVWVAPEHRGRGVGRLLLNTIVDWAREIGSHYVALDVTSGDSPAMRLYARAGFQPFGDPKPLRPGSSLTRQPMRLALRRDITTPSA